MSKKLLKVQLENMLERANDQLYHKKRELERMQGELNEATAEAGRLEIENAKLSTENEIIYREMRLMRVRLDVLTLTPDQVKILADIKERHPKIGRDEMIELHLENRY